VTLAYITVYSKVRWQQKQFIPAFKARLRQLNQNWDESPVQVQAYFLLIITTLLWGGNLTVGKLAVGHISPMMLNMCRWGLAAVAVTIVSMPQIRKDWPVIKKHWPLFLGYGAIGFASFNAFLYAGLQFTTGINAAIDQTGIPLLIFILNFVLFRVHASLAQVIGFAITLVGVVIAVSHGAPLRILQLDINFGDFLVMMAVLCYSAYTVSLRWKPKLDWRPMMMACCFGAFLAAIPMAAGEALSGHMILPTDFTGFGAILYTALFPSLISQALFMRGVELIGPNRAGLFINLIPVFGTILAVLFLNERLEAFHGIALGLAIVGIAIAERGKPRQPA